MNHGKLEVVKQEIARLTINIVESNEQKWIGMSKFNSDCHSIYYCGVRNPQKKWRSPHIHQKSLKCIHWCNLKNDRMILVCFQGRSFNITVIQVYAPMNIEEAEAELLYEGQQDLLELTTPPHPQKSPFPHRGSKCKSRNSRETCSNMQVVPRSTK